MKRIAVLYEATGGGHVNAVQALVEIAEQQGRDWQIEPFDVVEYLRPLDVVYRTTGLQVDQAYNALIRRGLKWIYPALVWVIRQNVRHAHQPAVRRLAQHWEQHPVDLVVSVVTFLNGIIGDSLRRTLPETPLVTMLTDFADCPPSFWIDPRGGFYLCGTERAVQQALGLRIPPQRIFRTSGMVVRPRFYQHESVDRHAERERLGLRSDLPTGLVLFGAEGSTDMIEIADRLDRSKLDLQLIFLCGRNSQLADALRARPKRKPGHVEGFTDRVSFFMRLADFFIGKPWPGSLSEALLLRLPVIVERNRWTFIQERYNADWVVEHQVGLTVRRFSEIETAVRSLLDTQRFRCLRENLKRIENRAVFEVADTLQALLDGRPEKAPTALAALPGQEGATGLCRERRL